MTQQTVLCQSLGPDITRITLNRPEALNAINADLLESLVAALRRHASSKIIIIEGAGPRSFCAGEDLKQTLAPRTGTAEELREAFVKLQDITRLTSSSSAIVIAAVQGFAIGGGAEIALAADFVIGGPAAKYRFPEVPIGHAATGGITLRLSQMVGLLKAKELLLTGRWINAQEALKIGLLSELVDDPKHRAYELALELAKLPSISLSASKSSLERTVFPNMETCLHDEVNVANYCFAQSDAAKAFSDFAARKPKVNGTAHGTNGIVNGKEHGAAKDSIPQSAPPSPTKMRDINTALDHAIEKFPTRTFLRFQGKDVTFGEFHSRVSKLAGGLRHIGIGPGDRVLVMMRNSVEMVEIWMAVNRLGAVWVPINVEVRSVTLKHVVSAAAPKIAIVDREFQSAIAGTEVVGGTSLYVNEPNGTDGLQALCTSGSEVNSSHPVKPSTTAAFLFTSGTTGKSKPCILSHEYFILQAQTLIDGCELRQDDVLYCPFPLFHADATALTTIPAILLGATAALSARFSVSRFWDEIRDTGATVYDFMGATLAMLHKQLPSPSDRNHKIRLAWGVPIPSWAPQYEERFGHKLITLYGSVEASLPVFQDGKLPLGSCGRVRPGRHLRIADDGDEELPPNTAGHLLLRSDAPNAFFQGYFNDPQNTATAFRGLWLHTGDLAKVDESGNVYFLGRVKDIIRRRGENVNAAEVEDEFLQHSDVLMAAAYGVPHSWNAKEKVDEQALWTWATEHMARFQVPSVIEIVPEIRRTATGKIEKHGLAVDGGVRFDGRKS
ncbi:putative crotonobetaine/carnitine-CoA ligase [Cyphellophora attinorum]|uniref:Putative crotonobetaine/carnitine-CoA ligase n=1 Tax=Cyphellophora attinorum TaxID=1664694 RepID=A0A0N1HR34_9EURO|nr:putative crotonobetaine/carnitine-CoA ligase [Phialophora attinorum]KPI40600.1 putative crotonobetaine/carnitine-CoA ligase [Phialophora attinorum]